MKNKVPGMDVPDDLIKRMAGVPKDKQAEEGITIAVETIERLKKVEGRAGFHIMAIEWEAQGPGDRGARRPLSAARQCVNPTSRILSGRRGKARQTSTNKEAINERQETHSRGGR